MYVVDFEKQTFDTLRYTSPGIDDVYYIKEDGLFVVRDNEENDIESFEVKAGDIIYKMYSCSNEYRAKVYIKITDPGLLKYYEAFRRFQQEKDKETVTNVNVMTGDYEAA